jgi:prepilin-type N-terminal cleavage/methylation domain-containing protein
MMRRGLTLLEVLLALALLASLVVGLSSWTTLAARFAAGTEHALQQESAAEALLRLVHDELMVGDFVGERDDERPRAAVDASDGALVVRSRAGGGEVQRRFAFNETTSSITLHTEPPQQGEREQVVLTDVADASWSIDQEARTLTVALTMSGGDVYKRRVALP